jgi:hypothetical protein
VRAVELKFIASPLVGIRGFIFSLMKFGFWMRFGGLSILSRVEEGGVGV